MGFLHQLYLLLWKNVTLKRRSPVSGVGRGGLEGKEKWGERERGLGALPLGRRGCPGAGSLGGGRGFLALFLQGAAA